MGFQVVRDIETNSLEGIALGISYETMRPIFVSIDQTLENLKNLLLTRKGERFYQPLFGSDLLEILFEPNISELKQEIQEIITEPINFWLPYVNIESIDIVTAEDDPTLNHIMRISINVSINDFETETITFTVDDNGALEVS
jgi:phage baseplate assembly protein W|tara:strand:+ start:1148 stop:1573 length:426 start_codon:yes stop_codon:yes gene_type:complete